MHHFAVPSFLLEGQGALSVTVIPRKSLFFIAILSLLSFGSVLAAEAFHHHGDLEDHDNCSMCSFKATGSQAHSLPAFTPILVPLFLFFFLEVFQPLFTSHIFISPSGRSPPALHP
jgi:hypothetical protein